MDKENIGSMRFCMLLSVNILNICLSLPHVQRYSETIEYYIL